MITLPKDSKDTKALRDFYTQQRAQVCSVGDLRGEPWLSHFNGIKGQYDSILGQLGRSEQVPAALLFGGLNGRAQFRGTGLTPLGKEAEARVAQMLASGTPTNAELIDLPLFSAPLLAGLRLPKLPVDV
jgi:hypothetical protein